MAVDRHVGNSERARKGGVSRNGARCGFRTHLCTSRNLCTRVYPCNFVWGASLSDDFGMPGMRCGWTFEPRSHHLPPVSVEGRDEVCAVELRLLHRSITWQINRQNVSGVEQRNLWMLQRLLNMYVFWTLNVCTVVLLAFTLPFVKFVTWLSISLFSAVAGIIAYFCPCYVFGKNAEAVGDSCLLCALSQFVPILDLWARVSVRGKIREQKGIEVCCFFFPCIVRLLLRKVEECL